VRETKHLYLRQSLMRDRLRAWIDGQTGWPILTTSIARKWLDDGEGLQDRGITRDLDWGIPVRRGPEPWPGMEGKVFYVWFDAPIEYIAATAEWADAHGADEAAWDALVAHRRGRHDVRYVQFMGKDNVPFHTLSFPATLLGANSTGRAVEARRLHQVLQLPQLRGRQVLDEPGPRRLHGPGARHPARRLLALVADRQHARELRRQLHLGGLPGRRQQGPRRRARQLRQPGHQVLPRPASARRCRPAAPTARPRRR
jgi:hypothetical protein